MVTDGECFSYSGACSTVRGHMIRSKPLFSQRWLQTLTPDYRVANVSDIDEAVLKSHGVKGIAFDADSTLVEPSGENIAPKTLGYLQKLTLPLYIATNRTAPNGDEIGTLIGAQKVVHATKTFRKPQKRYFNELASVSGIPLSKLVLVGDRLLTDIVGGNRAGMLTIYVEALGRDPWYIRYTGIRLVENLIVNCLCKKEL